MKHLNRRTAPGRFARDTLAKFGQKLRHQPTSGEAALWESLRNKQLGVKVRRQHSVHGYIADLYIPEWAVVIEVDGDAHDNAQAKNYDARRDRRMQQVGITVVRISNAAACENPLETLRHILLTLLGQKPSAGRVSPEFCRRQPKRTPHTDAPTPAADARKPG